MTFGSLDKNATFPTCFFLQKNKWHVAAHCLKTFKPGWWDVGAVGGTGGMDGETPVVALIGGSSSANTIPVASITAVLKVPQAGHIRYFSWCDSSGFGRNRFGEMYTPQKTRALENI